MPNCLKTLDKHASTDLKLNVKFNTANYIIELAFKFCVILFYFEAYARLAAHPCFRYLYWIQNEKTDMTVVSIFNFWRKTE